MEPREPRRFIVSLFITGADTGVGKTHCATQLLRLLGGPNDISWATNAEVLAKLISAPIVSMLNETDGELPKVWLEMLADSSPSLS